MNVICSQNTLGIALPELPKATPSPPLASGDVLDNDMPDLPKLPLSVVPKDGLDDNVKTEGDIISDDDSVESAENMYAETNGGKYQE